MKLSLFNSLSKTTEELKPLDKKCIKIYVCGPTVYDHPHIGNARSNVVYDLMFRVLRLFYGEQNVKYVRNITDIDDKIINRAQERGIAISELTTQTTKHFHDDMHYLNCLEPTHEPKATGHIDDMIDVISRLIKNGKAYESEGHVYFEVSKYDDYTKLSGRDKDSVISSGRVDHSPGKKNPEDFVLWKPAKEGDMQGANFDSPFGFGRPGWHIECSAMSRAYLGEDFDIHGGGADLIFPHHTNEIAQSCCAFPGSNYAKYWVHNGFLTVDGQKMSKSLGNFLTVYDLRKDKVNADAVRLLLLSTHYRKPLDFNKKSIGDSLKMIDYLHNTIRNSGIDIDDLIKQKTKTEASKTESYYNNLQAKSADDLMQENSLMQEFFQALSDDLNISVAMRIASELAKSVNSATAREEKIEQAQRLYDCLDFLGVMSTFNQLSSKDNVLPAGVDSEWVEHMIHKREAAKREKNWQEADLIRNDLSAKGISLKDNKDGSTSWSYKNA